MFALLISTSMICYVFKQLFQSSSQNIFVLLIILLGLTVIYMILLYVLKFITREELKQIPLLKQLL